MWINRVGVIVVMRGVVWMIMGMGWPACQRERTFACFGIEAFNMMMVAFLRGPHFGFKAQHGRAIFAHLAIHCDVAG